MSYRASELKSGFKVLIEDEPCEVIYNEFIKPGKGHSFNKIRFRNLISKKLLERVFRSTNLVDYAIILNIFMVYLYNDRKYFYFMKKDNFEQLSVSKKKIINVAKWLVEQNEYNVTIWKEEIVDIKLPNFIELKVIETTQCSNNDISGSRVKLAKLSNDLLIKVPIFIQKSNTIKVDTRSAEYVCRVNN